jgi:hypothetical protein
VSVPAVLLTALLGLRLVISLLLFVVSEKKIEYTYGDIGGRGLSSTLIILALLGWAGFWK